MEKETEDKLNKLLTEKGLLVNGMGILPGKFDDLIKMQDRTNFLLSMMEKKIERNTEALDKLINLMTGKQ